MYQVPRDSVPDIFLSHHIRHLSPYKPISLYHCLLNFAYFSRQEDRRYEPVKEGMEFDRSIQD